jgi:hypothetical protein
VLISAPSISFSAWMPRHSARHAAKQHALQASEPSSSHHNQIRSVLLSRLHDLVCWITFSLQYIDIHPFLIEPPLELLHQSNHVLPARFVRLLPFVAFSLQQHLSISDFFFSTVVTAPVSLSTIASITVPSVVTMSTSHTMFPCFFPTQPQSPFPELSRKQP